VRRREETPTILGADRVTVRLEFKKEDLWVGAFWKVTETYHYGGQTRRRVDLWICLLPMFPLHFVFGNWFGEWGE
jgi:hypothetical protein